MNKLILSLSLVLSLVGGSGCLSSRTIGRVAQAADKNATLVETDDVYSFAFVVPVKTVHQFWQCTESPGTMACKKLCDAKGSDLTCPVSYSGSPASVNTVK
jgi:hypothetical protein